MVQHKNSNSSGSGGHYVSCCYDTEQNEWWKFDDSIVKEITNSNKEVSQDVYMLIYEKVGRA